MIYAYDKLYLSVAQKNLACMLDYMVNNLKYPLETAWQWFCMSNTASRFERGIKGNWKTTSETNTFIFLQSKP